MSQPFQPSEQPEPTPQTPNEQPTKWANYQANLAKPTANTTKSR